MIGDACVVTDVNPASDAAKKGLKAGDVVLAVDGHRPTRDNLWKMHYRYYVLMPTRAIRLSVQGPGDAAPRQIEALSKVEKTAAAAMFYTNIYRYDSETKLPDDRFYESGDVLVWRMPGFDLGPERVDDQRPFRSALDAGVQASSASDAAVVTPDWLIGVAPRAGSAGTMSRMTQSQ